MYAESCAPRAVAALMRVSRHAAARALEDVGEVVGSPPGREATPLTALLWTMWGLGARLESFSVRGERLLDNDWLRDVHRRRAQGKPADDGGDVGPDPGRRRATVDDLPRGTSVAAWLDGPGRAGRWLLMCQPPGRRQHVLALEDGSIVAGDPAGRYGPARVLAAYRVQGRRDDG